MESETEKEEGRGAARLAMAAKLDLLRLLFLVSSPTAEATATAAGTLFAAILSIGSCPPSLVGTSTSLGTTTFLPLVAVVDTRRNLNPQSSSSTVSNPLTGPSFRFYTTSN